MRGLICAAALTWTVATLTVLPVSQAMAAQESGEPGSKPKAEGKAPKAAKTSKAVKTKKAAQNPQPGGSAESTADRTARLKRECRGAVNAGACTGYTQ